MRPSCTVALGFASALLLGACLRPAEDRARADLEVGRAEGASLSLEVVGGLAAVRGLAADRITLWAGAPRFAVDVRAEVDRRVLVQVDNAMPAAALSCSHPTCDVRPLGGERPTQKRWRVRLPGSTRVRLTVAPPDADLQGPFELAVLSDVQDAIGQVQDLFGSINQRREVRFVLGAGDLTEQGSDAELVRFQRELRGLRVPYYATLGNHELGTSPVRWHRHFGRASFHFVFRGVHFSLLDSGSATVDPLVYGWLDGWLEEARDRMHVVGMHIPPVDPVGVRNGSFASRNEAAKLLARLAEGGVDLTLYGHVHSYYRFDNAGIEAHISGGGGAVPERFDGIDRHYLWLRLDAQRGVLDRQIVEVD